MTGKVDIGKALAMLAQTEKLPPLENVERIRLDIPYITKANKVDTRPVQLLFSRNVVKPAPLVYIPHYEMRENSVELRDYLAEGWAVASPAEFRDDYNGQLTDDDLVFNNAALHALRRRLEIDRTRIALVGGSAGGYMTLMLNGLQLGLCASIANSPIANTYFNMEHYFAKAKVLNMRALAAKGGMGEIKTGSVPEMLKAFADLPLPFFAAVSGLFVPIDGDSSVGRDYAEWEELSPVGIADRFSSPIMVNHCTSDALVPVDQISRRYTYEKCGKSLPADFNMRLPVTLPGKLKYALDERLPFERTKLEHIRVPAKTINMELPFDADKQFNLNIFDDGPVESYSSHSARLDVGRRLDVPYLREMFAQSAVRTCQLTPGMLKCLLERYQGRAATLPVHENVDDGAYGSLQIYRQEVCDELSDWAAGHGEEALHRIAETLFSSVSEGETLELLRSAIQEINQSR